MCKSCYQYVRNREKPHWGKIVRKYNLKKYGITPEEYDTLNEQQNGVCAICATPPSSKDRGGKLHVDHCHTTGKVRGLLCTKCNMVLGGINDNIDLLEHIKTYLIKRGGI